MSYDDRRLAAIYDADNPAGSDHDYFQEFADRAHPHRVVDLGCGTGSLTVALTSPGREVVAIDPARAMLDHARTRAGGDLVEWRLGTSECIAAGSADLVLMSSNVAMHILHGAWAATLADIAAGLRPGGVLAFDTRNPAAEAWRGWSQPDSRRDTVLGRLGERTSTSPPDGDGVVTMLCHNDFLDDGGVLDVRQQLQFRTATGADCRPRPGRADRASGLGRLAPHALHRRTHAAGDADRGDEARLMPNEGSSTGHLHRADTTAVAPCLVLSGPSASAQQSTSR